MSKCNAMLYINISITVVRTAMNKFKKKRVPRAARTRPPAASRFGATSSSPTESNAATESTVEDIASGSGVWKVVVGTTR